MKLIIWFSKLLQFKRTIQKEGRMARDIQYLQKTSLYALTSKNTVGSFWVFLPHQSWQQIKTTYNYNLTYWLTFMLPSAEPVVKNSSQGSRARALMAESCAWNVWISCLCLMSKMQTHPFRPPDIRSWCFGAYWSTVAPWSWHVKPEVKQEPFPVRFCLGNSGNISMHI